MGNTDRTINYIEFPMTRNAGTKAFYQEVFGWRFTDWGPDYISFEGAGIEGGFDGTGDNVQAAAPGVLVVLYAKDLEDVSDAVKHAGGKIVKETFEFPGGKRFHFQDPNGNVLAVWSEG